ncbi:Uncharacterized protein Fot_18715 [Forsythia ovata]|uniref:Uncharacterized protein n=1 Tax=Forsythia ovata TaxID=205694 RepID=A0ABD1VIZ6_9LAMI
MSGTDQPGDDPPTSILTELTTRLNEVLTKTSAPTHTTDTRDDNGAVNVVEKKVQDSSERKHYRASGSGHGRSSRQRFEILTVKGLGFGSELSMQPWSVEAAKD